MHKLPKDGAVTAAWINAILNDKKIQSIAPYR